MEKLQTGNNKERGVIHFLEIAELEDPLEKILEEIGSQDFDLIIGDDASGRIPTLIISKFFRARAENKNQKPPPTIFIANTPEAQQGMELKKTRRGKITELVKKTVRSNGNIPLKVLIVTEYIVSGRTLEQLVSVLRQMGFNIKIATLGVSGFLTMPTKKNMQELKEKLGVDIIYGGYGEPGIYHNRKLAGVKKGSDLTKIHSQSSKKLEASLGASETEVEEIQKTINLSREDVNVMAERLISKFLKNHK